MRGTVRWVVGGVCIPLYCWYLVRRRGRGASSGGRIRAPPSGHVPRPPGPRSPCPRPQLPTAAPHRGQPGRGHPLPEPAAALPGQSPPNRMQFVAAPTGLFFSRPLWQRSPPNLPPTTDARTSTADAPNRWHPGRSHTTPPMAIAVQAAAVNPGQHSGNNRPTPPFPSAISCRPSRKTAAPSPAAAVPRRRPLPLHTVMALPCPAASSVEWGGRWYVKMV